MTSPLHVWGCCWEKVFSPTAPSTRQDSRDVVPLSCGREREDASRGMESGVPSPRFPRPGAVPAPPSSLSAPPHPPPASSSSSREMSQGSPF